MSILNTNDGNSRVNDHVTNEDYNATNYHSNRYDGTDDAGTPDERACSMGR